MSRTVPGINESATVSPVEARRLALAAQRALSVLADINGTMEGPRLRALGEDLARQARDAQGVLYACLEPFRDVAGRVADGLRVEGPNVAAPGEPVHPSALAIKAAAFNVIRDAINNAGDELAWSH